MSALIAPLTAQMQEMQATLSQVTQTADSGVAVQDSTRQLQRHGEWETDKIKFIRHLWHNV